MEARSREARGPRGDQTVTGKRRRYVTHICFSHAEPVRRRNGDPGPDGPCDRQFCERPAKMWAMLPSGAVKLCRTHYREDTSQ